MVGDWEAAEGNEVSWSGWMWRHCDASHVNFIDHKVKVGILNAVWLKAS